MGYTTIRILQQFERLERYWNPGDNILKAEVVMSPKNPVWVSFFVGDDKV